MKRVFEQLNTAILLEVKEFGEKVETLEGTTLDKDLLTKLPAILLRKDSVVVGGNEYLKVKVSLLLISQIGKGKHTARFKEQIPIIEAIMYKLHRKWLKSTEGDLGHIKFIGSKNLYSADRPDLLKDALEFEVTQVPYPTDYDEKDLNQFIEIQQEIAVDGYKTKTQEMLNETTAD